MTLFLWLEYAILVMASIYNNFLIVVMFSIDLRGS